MFDLVASIFGAYDVDSGKRLITEWFILIPKKNSKSTISAGIMLTALILNWRQSGEFTVIAPTIEVAGNAFSPARDMATRAQSNTVRATPRLKLSRQIAIQYRAKSQSVL